ncbi:Putative integral membrane protein (fragment) [Candidatus Sulfopaludibacter sp. SbA3]
MSGLLMGSFAPLIQNAMVGDLGLGPYSVSAIFGAAVFFSTFAFNLFFVNLAVEGEPVDIGDFVRAKPKVHLLGFGGGALWTLGATAAMVAAAAPPAAHLDVSLGYVLNQGFAVIAALWGVLAWRELHGSDLKVKLMAVVMLILFIGGIVLISLAPLYVRRG